MSGEHRESPGSAGQVALVGRRYRLDGVIGRGGFGVVHRATDELLQRQVAIKEVRLPTDGSEEERELIRERVLREARAAGRLHHPGAVAVLDVISEGDLPWIVMELVDGQSLSKIIDERGPLPVADVCRIGISVAYALEAAHRLGIVHRDVKPSNVLVTPDGRARLTDFGIAVSQGDPRLTSTGMVLGSPAYLAPERARGDAGSAASDSWGLGATLFTAVEGTAPFPGNDPLAILAAVVQGRRRPFRRAGPLAPVINDLMAIRESHRPGMAMVRARLREIIERESDRRLTRPRPRLRAPGRPAGTEQTAGQRAEAPEATVEATPQAAPQAAQPAARGTGADAPQETVAASAMLLEETQPAAPAAAAPASSSPAGAEPGDTVAAAAEPGETVAAGVEPAAGTGESPAKDATADDAAAKKAAAKKAAAEDAAEGTGAAAGADPAPGASAAASGAPATAEAAQQGAARKDALGDAAAGSITAGSEAPGQAGGESVQKQATQDKAVPDEATKKLVPETDPVDQPTVLAGGAAAGGSTAGGGAAGPAAASAPQPSAAPTAPAGSAAAAGSPGAAASAAGAAGAAGAAPGGSPLGFRRIPGVAGMQARAAGSLDRPRPLDRLRPTDRMRALGGIPARARLAMRTSTSRPGAGDAAAGAGGSPAAGDSTMPAPPASAPSTGPRPSAFRRLAGTGATAPSAGEGETVRVRSGWFGKPSGPARPGQAGAAAGTDHPTTLVSRRGTRTGSLFSRPERPGSPTAPPPRPGTAVPAQPGAGSPGAGGAPRGPARPAGAAAGRSGGRRLLLAAAAAVVVLTLVTAVLLLIRAGDETGSNDASQDVPIESTSPEASELIPTDSTPVTPPPGWVSYIDPTGWSIAYPAGWERRPGPRGEGNVDFVDPDTGTFLRIGSVERANTSAIEDWRRNEASFREQVRDYQQIRIEPGDGADGSTQADWEFTYSSAAGKVHVLYRGAIRNGHGYALYWHTTEEQWVANEPLMRQLFASFRPAP